jgi:predicted Zn-dependent protease
LFEALAGNRAEALQGADAALKQSQAPTVLVTVADIYARAGEDSKAEPLVRRAVQQRPDDLDVQSLYAPGLRPVLAMHHHDAAKALELLKKAEPFDRTLPEIRYTRATALLMSGRGEEAAQEFRAVLGLKGYTLTDPTFPMAQLGLAWALMLTDKATVDRQSDGTDCVSGFLRAVEECRCGSSPAETSQCGV